MARAWPASLANSPGKSGVFLPAFGTYTDDEASKTVSLKIDGTTLVNQLGLDQKRVITSISADEMRYRNPTVVGGGEIEFAWKRAR
jgi:hypothetical protein